MEKNRTLLRSSLFIVAALAALVLAACGGDDEEGAVADGPDPAALTPADAPIFIEGVLKPEGDVKENIEGALSKLLATEDIGAVINEELEAELSEGDISFSEDIEPVLGSTMGGFLTTFSEQTGDGAALFSVTDTGQAEELLDQLASEDAGAAETADYEGVTYQTDGEAAYGVVDDFVVIGTVAGFEAAVDASNGDSLADDSAATEALDTVPDDTVFAGYADPQSLIDAAVAGGAITQQQLDQAGVSEQLDSLGDEPVVFSAGATAESLSFETSGPATGDAPEPTDIVSTLPSAAWFAFGAPDVGGTIAQSYDQFVQSFEASLESSLDEFGGQLGRGAIPGGGQIPDLGTEIRQATGLDITRDFGWIGNVGGFVQGTSVLDIGGGLVIETDDPQQAAATLAKLRQALGRERSLRITPTDGGGFTIQAADAPVGAEVAIQDDKVVFAGAGSTVEEVLSPSETLADSDRFGTATDALGDDLDASFFLDVPPILSLAEGSGATSDPDYQMAAPYLSALDYLVAGGGTSDDRSVGRFVLGLKEPSEDSSTTSAAITP